MQMSFHSIVLSIIAAIDVNDTYGNTETLFL